MILKDKGFYGKKTSEKQLCTKNKDGGRRLWSFIDVYKETKVRLVYYMATSTELWSFIDVYKETKVRLVWYMATSTSGITNMGRSKPRS